MKKTLFGFIIGIIITLSIVVGATILYNASDIEFAPKDNDWNVNSVSDALNDIKDNYSPNSKWIGVSWNFGFNDNETEFKIPVDGTYKLELWGAEGATDYTTAGYGGYSVGEIHLDEKTSLFLTIPNKPTYDNPSINGGGPRIPCPEWRWYVAPGGGATHIAKVSGELKDIKESDRDKIIIVAGGGSGSGIYESWLITGASGGGYIGNSGSYRRNTSTTPVYAMATGGDQENGGHAAGQSSAVASFGLGGDAAGGGYYGGGHGGSTGGVVYTGAGGSGFINYQGLNNAAMYCYDCAESTVASINTISTTGNRVEADKVNCPSGYSKNPVSKCAKAGDGHIKITLVSID